MARLVEELRSRPSGVNERIVLRAALAYGRMLEDFARILTSCRRRQGLKMESISERTAVPLRRLKNFEQGAVAASWSESLLFAPIYGVRLSYIAKRLKLVLAKASGDDLPRIEAYLQCHPRMVPAPSRVAIERMDEKLKVPLNEHFVDVTIADWPSCFPPNLATLLSVEVETIVAQLRDINSCIARLHADSSERRETFGAIYRGVVGIATSLEWLLRRHCSAEYVGWNFLHHRQTTAEETTLRFVGKGMAQCRSVVIEVANRLEPFAGSRDGRCDWESPLKAEQPQSESSLYVARSHFLEGALAQSVLGLAAAATRLVDLKKRLA